MKKVIWTVVVTVSSAVATALTVRAVRYAWTRITHEEPPHPPAWAKLFMGGARSKITNTVDPASA